MHRTVLIHAAAPAKPAPGQPCNGCGVCCSAEPCPVGVLVSRRRSGACAALAWDDGQGRYVCGILAKARKGVIGRMGERWIRRMIAAGAGCDCSFEVERRPA